MAEFVLDNPPTDAISSVRFGPKNSQFLLASSWDCQVRLYDVEANKLKGIYKHQMAVLDCCLIDSSHAYSGGLDRQLKCYDFIAQRESVIGSHEEAIRKILYSPQFNLIITGSWDRYVKLWDPRSASCVGSYEQPDKIYAMDVCEEKLVVGTANRRIRIWDLNNMGMPESRESSLKFQTRAVACFPNKQGFVISSIEGRAAVDYFDMSPEVQQKKYAFKCHRAREDNIELVNPVNAIVFHNKFNTFVTGGSDKMVNIWDPFNKKRLCQFHQYPSGVTSLAMDAAGYKLAIASSYNYEKGEPLIEQERDWIYIRKISEAEIKPK